MIGEHRVIVETKYLKYDFVLNRQINLIMGDSGTGKTTLCDLIDAYNNSGEDSITGINISCDVPCVTLSGNDWEERLSLIQKSIVFIDENNTFVMSEDFAKAIKHSDNYYVIMNRRRLSQLPYSINCIYGFKVSGKYVNLKQTYNEIYQLYNGYEQNIMLEHPDVVLTEDSNSGFQFFDSFKERYGYECISADGKDNIKNKVISIDKKALIIADGAAFGSAMQELMEILKIKHNLTLYVPESFEWLILKSGVIKENLSQIRDMIEHPENYADTISFFSWERFFTHLIVSLTKDMYGLHYSKNRLADWYKQDKIAEQILAVMTKIHFSGKSGFGKAIKM